MRPAKVLLTAATGAGNSDPFYVPQMRNATVIVSPDLAGAETADIQISHDDGTTWVDYQYNGAIELTATKNAERLYGPALYRVAKDATAGATGIYLQE
jgi:hypothetical protein